LDKHQYSSKSISILDTRLQPWWNFVVSLMPMWLAPNLITMIGLVINVATSVLLMYACHTATEPAPRILSAACGVGLFAYQTLDAIDGKQARRTGTSSPLGEIFDHGCDSVSTVFVTIASAVSVSLGHIPMALLMQCFVASTMFYCAHWQTYVTGTMRFGKVDVTEGQFCVIAILMLSAICGPEFWDINLFWFLPMRLFPTILGSVVSLVSLQETIQIICSGGAGKNGSTVAGTSVLTPAVPLLLVVGSGTYIAVNSTEDVFGQHPILYIISFGLICTKITNKLIVAHMSKSELDTTDVSMLVPLALWLHNYLEWELISQRLILILSSIFVVVDVSLYSAQVCREICDHMNLYLFKIPAPSSSSSSTTTTRKTSANNGSSESVGVTTRSASARPSTAHPNKRR